MRRRTRIRVRAASAVVLAALVALLAAGVFGASSAFAYVSPNKASSTELVEHPKEWNGKTITFRGEAIGEAMVRGDMAWLHLNDDGYYLKNVEEGSGLHGYNSGMPVWLPADLAGRIETFGDYKHEGEVVEVAGVFNAACPTHGGDLDIHATALTRVIAGRQAIDRVRAWKVTLAIGLALVALVLWVAVRSSSVSLARGAVTRQRP